MFPRVDRKMTAAEFSKIADERGLRVQALRNQQTYIDWPLFPRPDDGVVFFTLSSRKPAGYDYHVMRLDLDGTMHTIAYGMRDRHEARIRLHREAAR